MNFKLVLQLSLFGAVMAVGSVFFIPPTVEPLLWLGIFATCAVILAKRAPSKAPLHGLFVSLANCVWITTAHVVWAETYLAGHPDEAAMTASAPLPPRAMMLLIGPLVGLATGGVLALFTFVATKLVKKTA